MVNTVKEVSDVSLEGFFDAVAGAAPGTEFRAATKEAEAVLHERMTLAGLTGVRTEGEFVVGKLPDYAEGHKVAISSAPALVDEDELLARDGLLAKMCPPLIASEAAAAAKSGRKPCKGCSCGLADVYEDDNVVDTKAAAKSNCGSCALGDAFRCAGCPYLGLPPFKPGEKIDISKQLMTSDI